MKKKLTVLLLCTMVAAAGCGSASSGKKTESAAQSTASAAAGEDTAASAAESEEEISEQINLSSAEDVKAAGLTDSELVEMEYYLGDGEAFSDGEYPSDEDFEEDLDFSDQLMVDVESAPESAEMPESGKYDSFIQLADYKGLSILLAPDTALEEGMTANIDYEGTIDGESFDGSSDSNFDLTIGTGAFIEGFEDQLIGHKKGEEFSISVPFPEDYFEEGLAGKTAEFKVRINSIYDITPDIALYQLVDDSKVLQYPQQLLADWRASMIADIVSWGFETFSTEEMMIENSYGSEEAFDSNVRYQTKSDLVCRAIMDKEGITEDSEEFTAAVDNALASYDLADLESAEAEGWSEEFIKLTARERICQDILVANCSQAS